MRSLKAQIAAENTPSSAPATPAGHPPRVPVPADDFKAERPKGRSPSREGKRAIVGHFSPEMSLKIAILARTRNMTIQALMGEAWDDLLLKYGEAPFGET